MAISALNVTQLNRMNRAAQNAQLGTAIQDLQNAIVAGTYTVVSADQTATTVSIPVGKTVNGFVVNVLRAGKDVTNLAALSGSTTNLVVATNGTSYVLTTGDVINYIVY